MAWTMDQGQAEILTGEAVAVMTPETPGRFVFASPHSGDIYPDDMGADPELPRASLRSAEDVWVDRLIAPAAELGASLVLGRLGRAYVDLNRDPEDLDALLIEGLRGDCGGARAAAGYGVIPRLSGGGWRGCMPPITRPWPSGCRQPGRGMGRRF
jgi:N-formylglutamate amidohydrolase